MHSCINILKQSIKLNKKGFVIKNNNINLNILKSFLKINIIKFIKIENHCLLVYINYKNNKPIFKNILNVFKGSKKQFISLKMLKKIKIKYNWIFILSTNRGLINSYEAIKKKSGGLILIKIWN